ncbi:MAG: hypothetical protein HDS38_09690 [Bacteroides sp.]|nr:hypothetical protein [Bacteroides sp.]MBD5263709.1 hypothetical protein [Bacteroides sp.]
MAKGICPIGIQDFPKIIEGGFSYVDNTRFVANLLPLYAPSVEKSDSPFNIERCKDDLGEGNPYSHLSKAYL